MSKITVEYVPLGEVEKWPRNPKKHDDELMEVSIETHGFNDPPAIDENTGRLVEGHGRIDALRQMKDLGKGPPERIEVRSDGEWLIPILKGISFVDEAHAEAYLLAHNRVSERGGWDQVNLHAILEDLSKIEADVYESCGFTDKDLDELTASLHATAMINTDDGDPVDDPSTEWASMPEYSHQDKNSFRDIIIKLKDEDAVKAFESAIGKKLPEKAAYLWYPEIEIETFADKRYMGDTTPDNSEIWDSVHSSKEDSDES